MDEPSLTRGEQSVMSLVREGMKTSSIAEILCISPRTVDHYIYRVCKKLNLNRRKEACAKATEMGILPAGIIEPHPVFKNSRRLRQ